MVDVNRIIVDFKEASRRKELERQAEIERKRQQRELNAEAIEDCIKTVIEPVLEDAKQQIVYSGFPCDVELSSKRDNAFTSARTFAIGIKILTQNRAEDSPADKCHLQYEGSFDSQEITKSEWIAADNASSQKSPPIAISRVDSAMIERDLEAFLRRVFKA